MLRGAIAAFVLALAPAVLLGQAPAADRLTLDLYWEYETVADPQASPDGSQIVYTRQGFDKLNDKRDSSLWIMNADGSRNRFLVRGGNARWPRSGDRIAYTSRRQTSIPPRSTRCSCASTAARTACSVGFNYSWQEPAASGYVVLCTNPRGSTGYGSAFGNMIMRAYPSKDHDDLMAGSTRWPRKASSTSATCSSPAAAAGAS